LDPLEVLPELLLASAALRPRSRRLRIARQLKVDAAQPPVPIAGSSLATRVEALVTTLRGSTRNSSIERSFVRLPLLDRGSRWKTSAGLEAVKACHCLRLGAPERESADRKRRVADGTSIQSPQFERA
jgi:hypothetical protein